MWVAGHNGMVGAALVRRLARRGLRDRDRSRAEVDLTRQDAVERWMDATRPQAVFVAAAKVGGILANDTYPAQFLRDNLLIEANIIDAAWKSGVEKLLFLGSSCIYPEACAAADRRGRAADGAARADQRMVRGRQDRRHQAVPGLPPAVRLRFHFRDADQPLRPRRQLRSGDEPRHPGAHPQGARGQAARRHRS